MESFTIQVKFRENCLRAKSFTDLWLKAKNIVIN